jgi:hypothetical protein
MSKQYDVKRLSNENRGYAGRITEKDVQRVNDLIREIEARSQTPTAGDTIQLTTKHGDYRPSAIIESMDDGQCSVCECPSSPFISAYTAADGGVVEASGGPWTSLSKEELKYIGKESRAFWVWGSNGPGANCGLYFTADVNLWEWSDPEPLYDGYSTKEYRKMYVTRWTDTMMESNSSEYRYHGEYMAWKSDEEFERFVREHQGTLFGGAYDNSSIKSFVLFYKQKQ